MSSKEIRLLVERENARNVHQALPIILTVMRLRSYDPNVELGEIYNKYISMNTEEFVDEMENNKFTYETISGIFRKNNRAPKRFKEFTYVYIAGVPKNTQGFTQDDVNTFSKFVDIDKQNFENTKFMIISPRIIKIKIEKYLDKNFGKNENREIEKFNLSFFSSDICKKRFFPKYKIVYLENIDAYLKDNCTLNKKIIELFPKLLTNDRICKINNLIEGDLVITKHDYIENTYRNKMLEYYIVSNSVKV